MINFFERSFNQKTIGKNQYLGIYNRFFKRIIGLILAIILLIPLLPVYLIIALCIYAESGFPIFYKADRGGYLGKPFKIYKFRSMVKNADKIGGGTTALNDRRITRVGRLLRKTKLDEIPQLLNIIRGDMCFIGPRPELLKYTHLYEGDEKKILKVRPGITDFSSIEFVSLDEVVGDENADEMYEKHVLPIKNQMRIKYADAVSLRIDAYLFFKTIGVIIGKVITPPSRKTEDTTWSI